MYSIRFCQAFTLANGVQRTPVGHLWTALVRTKRLFDGFVCSDYARCIKYLLCLLFSTHVSRLRRSTPQTRKTILVHTTIKGKTVEVSTGKRSELHIEGATVSVHHICQELLLKEIRCSDGENMDFREGGQVFTASPAASLLSSTFYDGNDNGWNCFSSFLPIGNNGGSSKSGTSGDEPSGQQVDSVSTPATGGHYNQTIEPPAPTLSSSLPSLDDEQGKPSAAPITIPMDSSESTQDLEEDASKSLAKEMSQLTVKEINDTLEDIHGVHTFNKEDPKYIDECVTRMKREINDISGKEAYKRACFLAPKKVTSRDFCLMFLRSTNFNIKSAAQMCVTHFEFKQRLFGAEKLTKDITLEDLDEHDKAALQSGYCLILPKKDTTGRAILFNTSKYATCKTWENQVIPSLFRSICRVYLGMYTNFHMIVRSRFFIHSSPSPLLISVSHILMKTTLNFDIVTRQLVLIDVSIER